MPCHAILCHAMRCYAGADRLLAARGGALGARAGDGGRRPGHRCVVARAAAVADGACPRLEPASGCLPTHVSAGLSRRLLLLLSPLSSAVLRPVALRQRARGARHHGQPDQRAAAAAARVRRRPAGARRVHPSAHASAHSCCPRPPPHRHSTGLASWHAMPRQARHLLEKMLRRPPAERLDAPRILKHAFLAGGLDTVQARPPPPTARAAAREPHSSRALSLRRRWRRPSGRCRRGSCTCARCCSSSAARD